MQSLKRKNHHPVWDHFILNVDRSKYKCDLCDQEYISKSSVTKLKQHYRKFHSEKYKSIEAQHNSRIKIRDTRSMPVLKRPDMPVSRVIPQPVQVEEVQDVTSIEDSTNQPRDTTVIAQPRDVIQTKLTDFVSRENRDSFIDRIRSIDVIGNNVNISGNPNGIKISGRCTVNFK